MRGHDVLRTALLAAASTSGCRDAAPEARPVAAEERAIDAASPGIGVPLEVPEVLPSEDIQHIVLENSKVLVDLCRAAAVKEGKSRYRAVMTVDPDGRAIVWEPEPPFTSLERCVDGNFFRITFPATKRGGKAEITLYF